MKHLELPHVEYGPPDADACVALVTALVSERVAYLAAEHRTHGAYDLELFHDSVAWLLEISHVGESDARDALHGAIICYSDILAKRAARKPRRRKLKD